MSVRYFSFTAGLAYLFVGVLGLVPSAISVPHAGDPSLVVPWGYGLLLGLFPVNVLHDAWHLGIGFWGVASFSSFAKSQAYARGLALLCGLLALMGLLPVLETTFGLLPLFGYDVWLYALTSLVAA